MPLPNVVSNILIATGVLDASVAHTEVHLSDGRIVLVPTTLFEVETAQTGEDFSSDMLPNLDLTTTNSEAGIVVPLIEERLEVGKRTVTTGKIRLRKTVHEFETALDEPLAVRSYDIQRVVLNRPVESAPPVRQEGEVTIYPLVEEQLILTKQLVLKEEIHVTKRDTERRDTQVVTLRREHVSVERESVT